MICGDAIIDLDLTAFAAFHTERGSIASLAAMQVAADQVSSYGIVVANPDGRISGFQEKPKVSEALSNLANTGIYLFDPAAIDLIPHGVPYDIGGQVFPDLVRRRKPFYAARIPFNWFDIGQVADYYKVLHQAMSGLVPGFVPPGREIAPGIRVAPNVSFNPERCHVVGPVWVGSSATIEDGASLVGPVYVGPGSTIESGAHVEASFVFDYTRVGSLANLTGSIASGQYCVNSEGVTVNIAQADLDWVLSDARTVPSQVPFGALLIREFLAQS